MKRFVEPTVLEATLPNQCSIGFVFLESLMKGASWRNASKKKRSQSEWKKKKKQSKEWDQPCCSLNIPLAKPNTETQNYLNLFHSKERDKKEKDRRCLEQLAL